MGCTYTAIIHLRDAPHRRGRSCLATALRLVRGVEEADFEPREALVTIRFDDHVTSLAELVRTIEDEGSAVASVAQRPQALRR